jgi:hypothetical protein
MAATSTCAADPEVGAVGAAPSALARPKIDDMIFPKMLMGVLLAW